MHYGDELISFQKKEGDYGGIFSYEEYQCLHKASTKELFQEWVKCTEFKELKAFEKPMHTYDLLKLIVEKIRIKKNNDFQVTGSVFDLILIPLCLLPFLFKFYKLYQLQKKIDKMKRNYE